MKRLWAAAIVGVLLLGGVACSRADETGSNADVESKGPQSAQARAKSAETHAGPADQDAPATYKSEGMAGAASAGSTSLAAAPDQAALPETVGGGGSGVPGIPQRVIKNANIEVKIGKGAFQSKFDRAGAIAEEFGGFVTNSSTEQTKGRLASGTLTIRVPADKFQAALTKLRGLGKVTGESQSGQDVTREFVDLEARLRHSKAQEAFFMKLMDQSKTISDLVQVQQQLSNVQLEIEQLQGQINYLKDQTSFSSITTRIFEPAAATGAEPKGLGKAFREAWIAFRSVIGGTVVFLGWVAPFAIIGLIGLGVWRLLRRKEAATAAS